MPPTHEGRLRRSLLALAALGVAGSAFELATSRHWESPVQLVAWVSVAVLATGVVLVAACRDGRAIYAARAIAAVVAGASLFGVAQHVIANYEAGPLDYRYEQRWDAMSGPERWWTAATKSVGPSPPIAPGILGQTALALALATAGHPLLAGRHRPPPERPPGRLREGWDAFRLAVGFPRRP